MILKFQMDVMVKKFNFKDLTNEYYDPTKNLIFEYKTNKIKRTPNQEEIKWIITQCRYKESPSRAKLISGKDDETIMKIIQNRRKKEIVLKKIK